MALEYWIKEGDKFLAQEKTKVKKSFSKSYQHFNPIIWEANMGPYKTASIAALPC